ncbi:MAG: hypothetical protein DRJ49_06085 [Thermoprotei archaeon]|nr:MAG: hypothetical protein DRJ49_06085 [Thermoprotei archaeon]
MDLEKTVELLLSLHPQQACSLAAVVSGAKPSTILESVEESYWPVLVVLARERRLVLSYRARSGYVMLQGDRVLVASLGKGRKLSSEELHCTKVHKETVPRPLTSQFGDFTTYVARDTQTLLELVRLREAKLRDPQAIRRLGELLGYPQCCVDSYVRKGAVRVWHEYLSELIATGLDKGSPIEFWAVYHAPCSLSCEQTLELGRAYLESLRRISKKAYSVVVRRLASSHLSYSLGRRFIDFHALDVEVPPWFSRMAVEVLPDPRVLAVEILRPYVYCEWEEGPYRLRATRDLQGLKYVAYSPGEGVLIASPSSEVYIYLTRKTLKRENTEYVSTVFRVYVTRAELDT